MEMITAVFCSGFGLMNHTFICTNLWFVCLGFLFHLNIKQNNYHRECAHKGNFNFLLFQCEPTGAQRTLVLKNYEFEMFF